jgi:hypothetical protein
MILTEENPSTGRKTCPSATSPTTNVTLTDLGSNADLRVKRPATEAHGNYMKVQSVPRSKQSVSLIKTSSNRCLLRCIIAYNNCVGEIKTFDVKAGGAYGYRCDLNC